MMFTVTFYSFKGGVGRSMALMNVAFNLIRDGKKVLIVDFDLEAPGLTTFRGCDSAKGKAGVIECVIEYLETDISPDVGRFIERCDVRSVLRDQDSDNSGDLYIMPAGNLESSYGSRYGKIDWRSLYEERQGFYFMEDLKLQWKELKFDYVLIDSRTGHTDVSGICTRHLPDVVVNVFFPNEQNLHGLKQIVSDIRDGSTSRSVELIFVASRVPDLDDEEGIIRDLLERFRGELSYEPGEFTQVHQYDSLALLEQEVFSASRPRTRLAKEYGNLTELIVTRNVADAKGALLYLDGIVSEFHDTNLNNSHRSTGIALYPSGMDFVKLSNIREFHAGNPSVMYTLSFTYYAFRQLEDAASAIDAAVTALEAQKNKENQSSVPEGLVYGFRSKVYRELGSNHLAAVNARAALAYGDIKATILLDVIRLLIDEEPESIPDPRDVPAINNMSPEDLFAFVKRLNFSKAGVRYGAKVTQIALERFGYLTSDYGVQSVLTFMGGGMFSDAEKVLGEYSIEDLNDSLILLFNRAMLNWALSKLPSTEDFDQVVQFVENNRNELLGRMSEANFNQCLAVAHGVLKNKRVANEFIERALSIGRAKNIRVFSCWSYRELTRAEFERDCMEIKEFINNPTAVPRFIQESA